LQAIGQAVNRRQLIAGSCSQAVGQAGLQTLAEDACLGLQACCKEVCEQGKIAHTFLQALPKH